MSKKILILHASDASIEAKTLKTSLAAKGYEDVVCISEVVGSIPHGVIYNQLVDAIEDCDLVISLVSRGLFNGCILSYAIGYAMGQYKIISALKASDNVLIPIWYDEFFRHDYSAEHLYTRLAS